MPTQTKTKAPRVKSPVAAAAYAWLARPDEGQQYSDGKYKVTLLLDKDDKDVKTWIKKLEATSDEVATEHFNGKPKVLNYCWKDGDVIAEEKDKEEFAGKWLLVAKTKFRPGMVDCGSPPASLTEGQEPASGDLIRIAFVAVPYEAGGKKGVAAQLRTVQLVEKRNNGSEQNDFESIDGGFTADGSASDDDDAEDF